MNTLTGARRRRGNRSNLERDVIAFLTRETCRKKVHMGMELRRDLGIDGDDALALLERYSVAFEVHSDHFLFSEYFGPEAGFEPVTWLMSKLRGSARKLKPLTVRMLVDAAENGEL